MSSLVKVFESLLRTTQPMKKAMREMTRSLGEKDSQMNA